MTTRVELLGDIDTWFARDDLSSGSKAGTFLRMAESKINRKLRVREMVTVGTLTTVASTRTVALPTDWLAFQSVTIDDSLDRAMTPTSFEIIHEGALWSQTGQPEEYAIQGSLMYLSPLPSDVFTLDVSYFSKLTALTNDTDTNAVLQAHYDLYLNAVLEQAALYTQDLELAGVFSSNFDNILQDVNKQDLISRMSGGAMRSMGQTARAIV